MAMISMVDVIELNADIARRAGGMARDLESDEASLMPNAGRRRNLARNRAARRLR